VTALYEVRPVADGPDELGTVSLRHRPVVGGGDGVVVEQTVPLRAADLVPSFDEASPDVRLAGTVAALAELLGRHPMAVERATTFDDLAGLAAELVGGGGPTSDETGRPDAAELVALIDLARGGTPPTEGGGERVPVPTPVPTPR